MFLLNIYENKINNSDKPYGVKMEEVLFDGCRNNNIGMVADDMFDTQTG